MGSFSREKDEKARMCIVTKGLRDGFFSPTDLAGSSWARFTALAALPDPRSLPLLLPLGKEIAMALLHIG